MGYLLFFLFFLLSSSNVMKFNDTLAENGIRHWPTSLVVEKKKEKR